MFYFLLFAVTTILFYLAQICGKRWSGGYYLLSFLAIFLLAFVAGCRDNSIGTDIHVYGLKTFNVARGTDDFWSGYERVKGYSELGYYSINYVSQSFSSKYGVVLFLQSFIMYSWVFGGVKSVAGEDNVAVGMLVYNLYFYSLSLNLMRQCLAIAFVLWSFRFFKERRPYSLLLCAVICFFLHKSSVVAYVIMFVAYYMTTLELQRQKVMLFICSFGAVCGVVLFGTLLSMITSAIPAFKKYDAYGLNTIFGSSISTMDLIIRGLMLGVAVVLGHSKRSDKRICNLLTFFLVVDIAAQFLGIYAFFTTRIGYYAFAIEIPLLLEIISQSRISIGTKLLGRICIIVLFAIYCVRMYYVKGDCQTYPFTSEVLGV